jgi:hypothetical protein
MLDAKIKIKIKIKINKKTTTIYKNIEMFSNAHTLSCACVT